MAPIGSGNISGHGSPQQPNGVKKQGTFGKRRPPGHLKPLHANSKDEEEWNY